MTTTVPTHGGPAMPYTEATDRAIQGRTALNVYLLPNQAQAISQGFRCAGGPAVPLYFVSDAELAAGTFVIDGDTKATPIYPAPSGMITVGGPALPVYLVNPLS